MPDDKEDRTTASSAGMEIDDERFYREHGDELEERRDPLLGHVASDHRDADWAGDVGRHPLVDHESADRPEPQVMTSIVASL